ncbi:Hcp family type VI secretion system effector [Devosia sp. Root635]|uniref:Hcp family type VI secretion system effector n=1 Tax=Devosia sp. Root635 TaxID=1736575 RepID=UPI000700A0BD|nr:type VI secretion system tube protein Hcp [Devosia sp. Root635]KRA53078.1 Hcp1 family type VI secretion system effector [Devosia sp. Root635]
MAVDMFLKIDPIKGESKDAKYKDLIDVLAFSWGASNSASFASGGGGGTGKVNVQDLSLTKYQDKASPLLFLGCAQGTHYKTAEMVVRKAGDKPLDYLKIKLTDVLISSLSNGGSLGEDRLTENVTLAYGKIEIEYTPQKQDGSGDAVVKAGWSIVENKKA